MPNIHGLSDLRKKKKTEDDDSNANNYYAGGVNRSGTGSGVAIQMPDDIFRNATANPNEAVANPGDITIIMYRNGFIIEAGGKKGPFRPLDDPANEPFLSDLRRQRIPRELQETHGLNVRSAHID